MIKQYRLDGLDCANCAAKIEKKVSSLPNVKQANIQFATQILTIETTDETYTDIITCIKAIEPHIVVHEITDEIQKKQNITLRIKGLDCANCAAKIETYVQHMDNIQQASLNFSTGILSISCIDSNLQEQTIQQIIQVVPTLEEGLYISRIQDKQSTISSPFSIKKQWKLYLGILLCIIALLTSIQWLYILAYVISGSKVLYTAYRNLKRKEIFDENFLMSIATLGAFYLGDYKEAVAVIIFYEIGEMFQAYAVQSSRSSISSLMDIRSEFARVIVDQEMIEKRPEEVAVGTRILVKPGERIPLDGKIIKGKSSMDTSALTGESLPVEVQEQDEVLAGSVNLQGVLVLQVTKPYAQSEVARILELVEHAGSKKAPMEKFITKFARIYTPIVVGIALCLVIIPPLVFHNVSFSMMLESALTFLVVSCPCALVISIPLGLFAGIGSASKQGVLIKGGNYLEALQYVDTVVFDKTGTLTKGVFRVTDCYAKDVSEDTLCHLAAYAEAYSSHPIAQSVKEAYGKEIDTLCIGEYEELAGYGVRAVINQQVVLVGNAKFMRQEGIAYEQPQAIGTILYVACNHQYVGYMLIQDEVKETSKDTIKNLRKQGVNKTVMLTGDRKEAGEAVAKQLGMDAVYTQLLPKDKVTCVEALLKEEAKGKKLAFVGDGMNDAPVLARVDIGIAMGGIGSDAAIEAADIVLMKDDPSAIVDAIRLAKKTMRILKQNITFSLAIKIIIMILAVFGYANMWMGVFADVGVTILAIFNAMRVLR